MTNNTFKVIIFGSRDFKDKELLFSKCDFYLKNVKEPIEIVSGAQKSYDKSTDTYYGADYFGELYAKERGYKLTKFPASWDGIPGKVPLKQMKKNRHGKLYWPGAVGYRNKQLAEYSDAGIGFPVDGASNRGTKNMIELCKKYNLKLKVVQ